MRGHIPSDRLAPGRSRHPAASTTPASASGSRGRYGAPGATPSHEAPARSTPARDGERLDHAGPLPRGHLAPAHANTRSAEDLEPLRSPRTPPRHPSRRPGEARTAPPTSPASGDRRDDRRRGVCRLGAEGPSGALPIARQAVRKLQNERRLLVGAAWQDEGSSSIVATAPSSIPTRSPVGSSDWRSVWGSGASGCTISGTDPRPRSLRPAVHPKVVSEALGHRRWRSRWTPTSTLSDDGRTGRAGDRDRARGHGVNQRAVCCLFCCQSAPDEPVRTGTG